MPNMLMKRRVIDFQEQSRDVFAWQGHEDRPLAVLDPLGVCLLCVQLRQCSSIAIASSAFSSSSQPMSSSAWKKAVQVSHEIKRRGG